LRKQKTIEKHNYSLYENNSQLRMVAGPQHHNLYW